jgi:hypothetical protein
MRGKRAQERDGGRGDELNRLILELARGQHGVVAARQLVAAGIDGNAIERRERAGWLRRLYRGVYAIGGARLTWRGRWLAGVLACGEGAVLSHQAAAGLWRLRKPVRGPIDVTVATRSGRRTRPGLRIHRCRLAEGDALTPHGIPATAPARTILDLAGAGLGARAIERAADEAERLRLCDKDDLRAVLDRNRGRPGAALLARVLDEHEIGSTWTRSRLEERFLLICRRRGLPVPLVNSRLLGLEPDFLWPDARLIVEVDGGGSHDTRRGFQEDRDRDSFLAAHGYRVLRFTWRDVIKRPAVVVDRVARTLALDPPTRPAAS